jgi:hypothetical protein
MYSFRPTLRAPLLTALAALLCAALLPAASASAQESRRFVVEVVGNPERRIEIPEPASNRWFAQFPPPRSLAGRERPKGRAPLAAVRLAAAREGDAVRLKVLAVFDDTFPTDAPGPKYGERVEEVADVLAREGETVTVEAFRDLGAEPLVLKLARSGPEQEMPPVPAPAQAVSRLKSIEVVGYATEGTHMERGTLTLMNLSQKGVVALELAVPEQRYTQTLQPMPGRVLVAPGVSYQTQVSFGRSARRTPHGVEPAPQAEALVVTSAVFEDGSYEGDTRGAAKMVAWQRGRLAQFARALALVQGALAAPGPETLAALRSQVEGLRIDAEPALVEGLLTQFPKLKDDEGRKVVVEAAVGGLRSAKDESLRLVEGAAGGADLRRGLESLKAELEKRAGPRRD